MQRVYIAPSSGNYVVLPRNPYALEGFQGWDRKFRRMNRAYRVAFQKETNWYNQSQDPANDLHLQTLSDQTDMLKEMMDDAIEVFEIFQSEFNQENDPNRHNTRTEA